MNFQPRWETISDFVQAHKYKNIVEIGVNKCETTFRVLMACPSLLNYHLIDIVETPEIKSLNAAHPEIEVYILTSKEAAKKFESKSLDLVFIDANHTYEAVKEDIALWLPKVRLGGVICGHDYHRTGNIPHNGVKRAVDEVFKDVNLSSDECPRSDRCVWWEYKYV